MTPPCENCITLGLCKAQLKGDIASLLFLTNKCELLNDFLDPCINSSRTSTFTIRSVGEFIHSTRLLEASLLKGIDLSEKIDMYKRRIKAEYENPNTV